MRIEEFSKSSKRRRGMASERHHCASCRWHCTGTGIWRRGRVEGWTARSHAFLLWLPSTLSCAWLMAPAHPPLPGGILPPAHTLPHMTPTRSSYTWHLRMAHGPHPSSSARRHTSSHAYSTTHDSCPWLIHMALTHISGYTHLEPNIVIGSVWRAAIHENCTHPHGHPYPQ